MDEEYDAIVLGTGLKECIISGLLSVAGKKVLHMDKNSYYGGESASLTPLVALYDFHGNRTKTEQELKEQFGKPNDWNVDIIPKLIMANGELVKMLVHSTVTRYLEFKSIEGSYVFYKKKLSKIPATDQEALATDLVGFLKKKSFHDFVKCVIGSGEDGSVSKKGYVAGMTTKALFELFNVTDLNDVCGHAIALYLDDDYLKEPCEETVKRLKLYFESVSRYGKSPYLYPLYGLGELPQGFARLSAVHGGTYMLNKPIEDIVMEDGKVVGVTSEGETAKTKMVIGDPTYFPKLVKKTGQVVRIICILDHPVIKDKNSLQIIFPCSQLKNRKSDIYVCCVSSAHKVASPGHYIAIASCKVETDEANAEKELDVALEFLKPIKEKFVKVTDLYEPVGDGKDSNVFITTSYDATTHFESTCRDIIDVYKRATGENVDFSKMSSQLEQVE